MVLEQAKSQLEDLLRCFEIAYDCAVTKMQGETYDVEQAPKYPIEKFQENERMAKLDAKMSAADRLKLMSDVAEYVVNVATAIETTLDEHVSSTLTKSNAQQLRLAFNARAFYETASEFAEVANPSSDYYLGIFHEKIEHEITNKLRNLERKSMIFFGYQSFISRAYSSLERVQRNFPTQRDLTFLGR